MKIDNMKLNHQEVFIEDIHELVYEISNLEIEFPRYLLEPIFILCNEKIKISIETENLYALEIL